LKWIGDVPSALVNTIEEILRRPEPVHIRKIIFAPNGGWAILYGERCDLHNLPAAADAQAKNLLKANYVIEDLIFSQEGGWVVVGRMRR
jgi:hypothetical protein